jgi:CRISPR/Cas system-associated exonuclease Cas4 (RecB family)
MDKIILRPSSIDTFLQCPQQWYRVFILGETSIPNSRAAIGTAIHAGVEQMWLDSMQAKTKVISMGSMADAAVEAFEEEEQKDLQFDANEDRNTCHKEILVGLDTYVEDITPYVPVPTGVEQRFTVNITDHPIVEGISGQLDYVDEEVGVISDLKTGKRKHNVANSSTQQSIYNYLAEENGVKVNVSTIQNVVLKAKPEGHIMDAQINKDKAKNIVNTLLDVLEVYNEDKVDPDMLFRGNPKYYLCSPKYCKFFEECKFS